MKRDPHLIESEVPHRVQRKRTKGWKMPPNTICVTRPGKWGNPYMLASVPHRVTRTEIICYSAEEAVANYRAYILANQQSAERFRLPIGELRGKNLACFCRLDQPCHADVLLEIANA